MAKLPELSAQRPVARPSRALATISPNAAGAVGAAMQGFGQTMDQASAFIQDREDTAAVKERDAYVSDEIRKLLYDPQSGFANQRGKDAVASRAAALSSLEALTERATDGMSASAKRKYQDTLRRRVDSAMQTVDVHTSNERSVWLDDASKARIEAAKQDALTGLDAIGENSRLIVSELRQQADREGWDDARLDIEIKAAKSGISYNYAVQVADKNPLDALAFVEKNKDDFLPSDYDKLTRALKPEARRYQGTQEGNAAFARLGNMSGLMEIASDTLGMNENEQRDAIQSYLSDGGVNLDPAKTAWCAAFINATLGKAGMTGTGSLMARSFLKWGQEVSEPREGDVVVLSRGSDPASGHVGFFKGYAENGDIILLGGNQSDSVSEQAYSRSRLLGYRRAVTNPNEIDAATEIQRLAQIEDPDARKAALETFNLQYSAAAGAKKARHGAAENAAFQYIETGADPASLPLDVRQTLGMETMSSLRTYYAKTISGTPQTTDPATYLRLREMQANDPEGFAAYDILSDVNQLSPSDLKGFIDAKASPPTTGSINDTAASTLMTVAKRRMDAAGISKVETEARLQTNLLRWQDTFIKENSRAPSQLEIDERVGRELMEVIIDPPGLMNKFSGAAVEAPNIDVSKLADTSIRIGEIDVPPDVINAEIETLRASGEPVTSEAVLDRIMDALASAGLLR